MMNDPNRSRRSKWDTPSAVGPPSNPPPAPTNAQMAALEKSVEGQVSSLEAASAAAARINAMLISKGKLKLPTGLPPAAEPDTKQKPVVKMTPPKEDKVKNETLVAEVEINEVPIQCRNQLTKGSTQEEISRLTGAAVSTRGRYMSYADRATNNMGERPLYLCVQGPTKESVDRAVDHIKGLIGGGIQNKTGGTGGNRTRTRFSAATSGPATAVNTRPPGAPILSRPPAPGLGAPMRGPAGGAASGLVGGVGGGGPAGGMRAPGPSPMVPPPAIQMAIQSAQSSGHYMQDKVFVGLEHADPSFNVKDKVQGPGGSFIQHIRAETGANIYLRGRGSGFMEPTSGREAFENLYLYVTHPKADGLQAAKKLCENLVGTIQAEYMTHQSQVFQRSAPAMAAAHMIAPASRPGQPMTVQPQAPLQQAQQPPRALGLHSQAPPAMSAISAASTSLSQTLAAQQQAQAILGAAQRTAVSTAVSVHQGVAYPSLQPQAGLPAGQLGGPGAIQPQPVPAPVPPPQRILQQQVITPASQPQLYAQQVQVVVSQPGQHTFAQAQAQAQAAVQAAQAQVQAHVQMVQAQGGQIQAPVQPPQATVGGLPVGTPQPGIPQPLGALQSQPSSLQQQQAVSQHQPVKRRFREDLPPEQPEHHPPPMTNLGVSPPGQSPLGMAGGIRGSAEGGIGQGSLMRLPGQQPDDIRLMPPPPNPQAMRDAGRKRLMTSAGLDIHGGRLSPEEEARIKRGRLVSYDASGDSDEDDERNRFDAGGRFRGYMGPPPRGIPPPSSLSTSTATSSSSSTYHKAERRELGAGSSPFWMARN